MIEILQEGLQFLLGGTLSAPDFPQQGRIRHSAATDHDGIRFGELLLKGFDLRHSPQIAVVADRIFAVLQRPGKHIHMEFALVFLLLHAGVNRHAGDRIAVIDLQNPVKLIRIRNAHAGLDGNRDCNVGKHLVEEPVQFLGPCQKTGAFTLGRHRAGRAAQIQIHFRIPQFLHPLRTPDEIRCLAAHDLRNNRQATVVGRIQFPEISGGNCVVVGGRKERNKVPVRPAEVLVPHFAEHHFRDAVQRGKIISLNHFSFSSHSC